jgi:enoyl-CoA hydratase/carnithine racemase
MDPTTEGSPPSGDWLGTPFVRFERKRPFARCVVDRPHRRNALTGSMYFAIRYAIEHVNREPELAGLLITGTGDVFIPGGDMSGDDEGGWSAMTGLQLGMDALPFETLRRSVKPVVCAVNGLAQGGGLMIAMLSDVSVASDRATFRAPELLRGIADTNYAQVLPRQIGPARARDMLFTGRTVTASEALEWGLVARVVPHDELLESAGAVLASCSRTAPGARRDVKGVLDRYYGAYDRIAMDASLGSEEALEGFRSFKERRSPAWVHPELREEGRL